MGLRKFVSDDPSRNDADTIDRTAVIAAVGAIFPARFARFTPDRGPAVVRHERFVRIVQYYVWYDQHTSFTSAAKRKRAMQAVVSESEAVVEDDEDDRDWILGVEYKHLNNCLEEGYADRAGDDALLQTVERDLQQFADRYETLTTQA